MTKIRIRYLLLVVLIAVIVSSCQSNEIHIDFDKQLICSSNSTSIEELSIENANSVESFSIIWTDSMRNPPLQLSLFPLTKGCVIVKGWRDTLVNLDSFNLSKNTIYRIKREGGDAGPCTISAQTDDKGHFQKIVPYTNR